MKGIRQILAVSAMFCFACGGEVRADEHSVPCPWILEKDYDMSVSDNPISTYVRNLGSEDREAVIELDKQLRARIAEDRRIIAENGPGKAAAEKEIERYETFLDALYEPIRMNFTGSIDLEKKKLTFVSYQVALGNHSVKVMPGLKKDGQRTYYFYGDNDDPEYIREKDLPLAQAAIQACAYINLFCGNQPQEEYTMTQSKAAVSCIYGREALKNNSPDVIVYHPMPAKGALHDGLAQDALVLSKRQYPNAVDAIIGSNDWIIQRNAIGVIIRRVCVGWIVVKDDIGLVAIPSQWAEENQGGDTYGKLRLYRYGSNKRFYVK